MGWGRYCLGTVVRDVLPENRGVGRYCLRTVVRDVLPENSCEGMLRGWGGIAWEQL